MVKDKIDEPKFAGSLAVSLELLFAVIIGVTFFNFYDALVPLKFDFYAVMVLVAFITVIADMIGFMKNIEIRPYRTFKRYLLDLIILYLYFQLLYSSLISLEFFFRMYVLIFGAYLIWVWFEYREYKNDKEYRKTSMKARYVRKAVCLAISIAIWIYYEVTSTTKLVYGEENPYGFATLTDWFLLFSILATVIGMWVIASTKKQYVQDTSTS
ncbi:MAG: hypothetical protein AB1608_05315 [Thermoproteota archaeon]